jgi:hypothetical protein
MPGIGTTWAVRDSKENWFTRRTKTIGLLLPLCPECNEVSRESGFAQVLLMLGLILAPLVCISIGALVASATDDNLSLACPSGLAALAGSFFLLRWLSTLVENRGLTAKQKQRRKLVKLSARLSAFGKQGGYLFEFENPVFAAEFAGLNGGQVVQAGSSSSTKPS